MADSVKLTKLPRRSLLTFGAASVLSLILLPAASSLAKDGGRGGESHGGDSGRGPSSGSNDNRSHEEEHEAENEQEQEQEQEHEVEHQLEHGVEVEHHRNEMDIADHHAEVDDGNFGPDGLTNAVKRKLKKHKAN